MTKRKPLALARTWALEEVLLLAGHRHSLVHKGVSNTMLLSTRNNSNRILYMRKDSSSLLSQLESFLSTKEETG